MARQQRAPGRSCGTSCRSTRSPAAGSTRACSSSASCRSSPRASTRACVNAPKAWNARNLGAFRHATARMAAYLVSTATDSEPLGGSATARLGELGTSLAGRRRAVAALRGRLESGHRRADQRPHRRPGPRRPADRTPARVARRLFDHGPHLAYTPAGRGTRRRGERSAGRPRRRRPGRRAELRRWRRGRRDPGSARRRRTRSGHPPGAGRAGAVGELVRAVPARLVSPDRAAVSGHRPLRTRPRRLRGGRVARRLARPRGRVLRRRRCAARRALATGRPRCRGARRIRNPPRPHGGRPHAAVLAASYPEAAHLLHDPG